MELSIDLTEEQEKLVREYSLLHGLSVSETFKRALFEKIEDEYDAAVADAAYREYLENPKSYTHEEVRKMLGFDE